MQLQKRHSQVHSADVLFTLLLFGLFAFVGISVVLIGSRVYQSTVSHMDDNYTTRTALAYVAEKVRQTDTEQAVHLIDLSSYLTEEDLVDSQGETISALALDDTIDGSTYRTYIYYYDGALRELFVRAGASVTRAQGTAIVTLDSFTIEEDTRGCYLLSACSATGQEAHIWLRPKAA